MLLLLGGCAASGPAGAGVQDARGAHADGALREEVAALRADQRRAADRVESLEREVERLKADMALRHAEREELREEILKEVRLAVPVGDPREGPVRVEVPPAAAAAPIASAPPPATLYREAYDSLIQENYGDAIAAFTRFLKAYPRHEFADEARFNLGESYFALRDYGKALIEYSRVAQDFPGEPRAPDALYRAGQCYERMGQKDKARATFRELIDKHPGSAAAAKARDGQGA